MLDFAIIGAGVAGSILANLLIREGFSVAVYDMSSNYVKPCGEVVPLGTLELLRSAGLPLPVVVDRIRVFEFLVGDKRVVYEFSRPLWASIERGEWVNGLRESVGVVRKAVDPRLSGIRADVAVVDARGPFGSDGVHISVWRGYADNVVGDGLAVSIVSLSPRGLAWLFSHGDSVNIGGGFIGIGNPKELAMRLIRSAGYDVRNVRREAYSIVTVHPRVRRWRGGNIVAVGEAAGFIQSLGGEGIRPAVESAIALAKAASAAAPDFWEMLRLYESATARLEAEAIASSVLLRVADALVPLLGRPSSCRMVERWLSGRLGEFREFIVEAVTGGLRALSEKNRGRVVCG